MNGRPKRDGNGTTAAICFFENRFKHGKLRSRTDAKNVSVKLRTIFSENPRLLLFLLASAA